MHLGDGEYIHFFMNTDMTLKEAYELYSEYIPNLDKEFIELDGQEEAFQLCREWISKRYRKTINRRIASYGYKHEVEREIHMYVAEQTFCLAALSCHMKYKRRKYGGGQQNMMFNIKNIRKR